MTVHNLFPRSPNNEPLFGALFKPEHRDRDVWKEDVKLLKKAGVNVVSIGTFSWALLEVDDSKWDFGWFDDIFELLHKNGIATGLEIATASPLAGLTTRYPEIPPVSKNGETCSPDSLRHYRVTSPMFRKHGSTPRHETRRGLRITPRTRRMAC